MILHLPPFKTSTSILWSFPLGICLGWKSIRRLGNKSPFYRGDITVLSSVGIMHCPPTIWILFSKHLLFGTKEWKTGISVCCILEMVPGSTSNNGASSLPAFMVLFTMLTPVHLSTGICKLRSVYICPTCSLHSSAGQMEQWRLTSSPLFT